jgi:acetoin utilization protein AcuB
MKVETFMSNKVISVEMDDSVKVVKEIFDNTHFHHLLVTEDGKLQGIISDRDLLKVISPNLGTSAETPKDVVALNKKAHQIMTRHPVTITLGAEINIAADLLLEHKISCLPVVDTDNNAVGIVSWRDILRAVFSDTRLVGRM